MRSLVHVQEAGQAIFGTHWARSEFILLDPTLRRHVTTCNTLASATKCLSPLTSRLVVLIKTSLCFLEPSFMTCFATNAQYLIQIFNFTNGFMIHASGYHYHGGYGTWSKLDITFPSKPAATVTVQSPLVDAEHQWIHSAPMHLLQRNTPDHFVLHGFSPASSEGEHDFVFCRIELDVVHQFGADG